MCAIGSCFWLSEISRGFVQMNAGQNAQTYERHTTSSYFFFVLICVCPRSSAADKFYQASGVSHMRVQ